MTSLLLIVSFLLHAVLLIAIYQLYQQLQQMKQTKENESQQIVQQFIAEIKEENKHLQAQITAQYASPDVNENKQLKDKSNMTYQSTTNSTIPTQQQKKKVYFEGNVHQLYQQGFDVDQITKQLNSGRTEVDLIIKLQSQ